MRPFILSLRTVEADSGASVRQAVFTDDRLPCGKGTVT